MCNPSILVRTWARGTEVDERLGVLGYVSLAVGDFLVDGIVLRQTGEGRLALGFPKRTSRSGERHSIVRPADGKARDWIEREVVRQLAERFGVAEAMEVEP